MQLNKQLRRAVRRAQSTSTPVRIIKLASFNPVLKEGQILSASTIHNFEGVTHVAVSIQRTNT